MKKIFGSLFLGAVLVSSGYTDYENNIVDVTGWKEIRGITTPSDAAGYATASFNDVTWYALHAKFLGLTAPMGDDFYEWWIVRKEPFTFISTWKVFQAELVWGHWENNFSSDIDYTDYDFYVLTLEPNDGNPAPADHIVEWDVVAATMMKHVEKKEVSDYQKSLRMFVKNRIEKIGISKLNTDKILERIWELRIEILGKWYSQKKIDQYTQVLDAVEYVLMDIK